MVYRLSITWTVLSGGWVDRLVPHIPRRKLVWLIRFFVPFVFWFSLGVVESLMAGEVMRRGLRDHHKVREYKAMQSNKCYVVESNNLMEKVSSLSVQALVGRLEYCRMDPTG